MLGMMDDGIHVIYTLGHVLRMMEDGIHVIYTLQRATDDGG